MQRREFFAGLAAGAAGAAAGFASSQDQWRPSQSKRQTRFPNVLLTTHEGKRVRFFDDLIHGKVVMINFMYADCAGMCPFMTSNLAKVQRELGDRVGRDVYMYSITLRPELDTAAVLRSYAERHKVKPGWLFLTGSAVDIELLRRRLGFFDPDPEADKDRSQHIGMVAIGNEPWDRWVSCPVLNPAARLAGVALSMEALSRTARDETQNFRAPVCQAQTYGSKG